MDGKTMSRKTDEDIKRWAAKRKSALVLPKMKTTAKAFALSA
jgi:hypothetical protein